MKEILLIFCFILQKQISFSQNTPDSQHSTIEFRIKNFGVPVTGNFSGLNGEMFFDPKNLSSSRFNVSVDAASVNTDNSLRDNHLRGESYFDVKNYPRISFISTRIAPALKKGVMIVFGKLRIKNITKDISFPFVVQGTNDFKGSFKINRRDFDVGGTSIISDELEVFLDVKTK